MTKLLNYSMYYITLSFSNNEFYDYIVNREKTKAKTPFSVIMLNKILPQQ